MTQEEKQLLIKDLCGRLPYGVLCGWSDDVQITNKIIGVLEDRFLLEDCDWVEITAVKPYLRSMSSMTDEEEDEYRAINCYEGLFPRNEDALDYALEHHLDFRNLIGKGLALEATEDMYKND